jgi:hypothetical protein
MSTTFRSCVHATCWLAILAMVPSCGSGTRTETVDPDPPRALDPATCPLDAYAPLIVQPHYEADVVIRTAMLRLHGADVFIAARAGLTAEWLGLAFAPGAAIARDCALGVAGAEVAVASQGPGFRVTIRARDEQVAREILWLALADEAHR